VTSAGPWSSVGIAAQFRSECASLPCYASESVVGRPLSAAMNDKRALFVTDEDVPGRILKVIRDARKYIVLVTPYLDLWDRAEQAIKVAVRNGVEVTVIIRKDPKVLAKDDVAWLIDNGVRVLAVDDLHAKIYMNEESVVLSSMNLTHGSTTKSLDFAVVLQDEDLSKEVRDYVSRTVGALADEVKGKGKVTKFFNRIADAIRGHCIRCGRAITKNPDRPLCDDCYDVWAEYENSDFQEKVCHSCGEPAPTSYAKPLCAGCYRSAR